MKDDDGHVVKLLLVAGSRALLAFEADGVQLLNCGVILFLKAVVALQQIRSV